jgi:hypothetical protein
VYGAEGGVGLADADEVNNAPMISAAMMPSKARVLVMVQELGLVGGHVLAVCQVGQCADVGYGEKLIMISETDRSEVREAP